MAFAKFQENRLRIDGEIAENHAILVNLTASIDLLLHKNIRCTKIPEFSSMSMTLSVNAMPMI